MTYPNYYQPYQFQQQSQQNQNGIIWVQGEAGAKSYLVAPNTTVQLWDSEAQVIYLKSADNVGMPTIKILDYTIRDKEQPSTNLIKEDSFATKQDIEELAEEIASIKRKISNRSRKIKEEEMDNE